MRLKDSAKNESRGIRFRLGVYEFFRRLFSPFRRKTVSRRVYKMKYSYWRFAWLVLLLPGIHFFIFYVYVNLNGILIAFREINTGAFTLKNFVYVWQGLTTGGAEMFLALRNTFIFWGVSWILMPINILVSFLLYKRIYGYKIFQVIFYLPTIIGGVVWMTAYKNFIAPTGPLCDLLINMGAFKADSVPEFLANSQYALSAVVMSNVWLGIPASMLIYCGSLCRIPQSVIEAAKLDGIGFWSEIWYIILPLLGPLIGTNVVFNIIGLLNASGNVLLLTGGRYGTTTLNYWFYEQIVVGGNYNIPSAMGLLMTFVTIPLVVIGRKVTNKIENVEY